MGKDTAYLYALQAKATVRKRTVKRMDSFSNLDSPLYVDIPCWCCVHYVSRLTEVKCAPWQYTPTTITAGGQLGSTISMHALRRVLRQFSRLVLLGRV
jgi:hypothetical protein